MEKFHLAQNRLLVNSCDVDGSIFMRLWRSNHPHSLHIICETKFRPYGSSYGSQAIPPVVSVPSAKILVTAYHSWALGLHCSSSITILLGEASPQEALGKRLNLVRGSHEGQRKSYQCFLQNYLKIKLGS